ncbi:MAG: hypothetical protein GX776_03765, partial [Oxalobacter sp.]|nr:hypothetical protein [Oxalobacter sp.]
MAKRAVHPVRKSRLAISILSLVALQPVQRPGGVTAAVLDSLAVPFFRFLLV